MPKVILCVFALFFTASVYASNQTTLLGSAYTPTSPQVNIITALSGTSLPLKQEVKKLYELQAFKLLWSDGSTYNANAKQLLAVILNAEDYGLDPFDYDVDLIQAFLEATSVDPKLLSKSDIVFSHAYVKLASHIKQGKYTQTSALLDHSNLLLDTLSDGITTSNIADIIESLLPTQNHTNNLIQAIKKYRRLENQQTLISIKKRSLGLGDRSHAVIDLRKTLHALGDLKSNDYTSDLYDEELMLAVSDFQIRHGLEGDGVLGKQTLHELNTPITHRINQLELNLSRAQSLSIPEADRFLLVNIPAYQLYVYDNKEIAFQTRVVVGKKKHKTPLLSSALTKIILSPYWNVPKSITNNEIIPAIQKDPDYLVKNNMQVLSQANKQTILMNPNDIDWINIDSNTTPFRIRQTPGNKNSLGQIKFIFPNAHSVYLHDTPARNLFAKPLRAFSHGCVRLEDPFGLAAFLLSNNNELTTSDMRYLAMKSKSKVMHLEQPIPIHITYMTAWADEQGVVNFRPDVYKRDSQLAANLYNASN